MPDCNKSRALYSTCITGFSFACFALAATAAVLPLWGYFTNPASAAAFGDKGHFGPWQICKESYYMTKCGDNIARFKPVLAVKVAGYFAAMGVIFLALFCLLNVLHLAMVISREKVVFSFQSTIISKLVFSLLSVLTSVMAVGIFSLQDDDKANNYQIVRGESFYMQVGLIILNLLLFVSALYDMIIARRDNGDPTVARDPTGIEATTINNPGFRDKNNLPANKTINVALTAASGNPYASISGTNGSASSVITNLSSSNGSAVPSSGVATASTATTTTTIRSPLRPSLKKPKVNHPETGLGIPNPGYSGSSPTLTRNGSVKKVRIQTQSTAV